MMSVWGWIADAILAILLTATLFMAIRLDRALRVVRRDRAVFEALINNLGSATNSVKLGIQALRNEADRAAEQIERRSEDADKLATDLSFLIEAADRAGARLEEGRLAQALPQKLPEAAVAPAVTSTPDDLPGTGLRQLAGIAKRRRPRTPAADRPPEPAVADVSEPETVAQPAKMQGVR